MPQGDFVSEGYDPTARAYVINHRQPDTASILSFQLAGNSASPIVNPAFVIKSWGPHDAKLDIDGKPIEQRAGFRKGRRATLEGEDLIVWLKVESNQTMSIQLAPV
jgi:hypothetical protein